MGSWPVLPRRDEFDLPKHPRALKACEGRSIDYLPKRIAPQHLDRAMGKLDRMRGVNERFPAVIGKYRECG